MVEREEIRDRVRKLVPKDIRNQAPNDEEIWEGEENGARFMLTRDIMPPNPAMKTIYSLSVSGDLDGQVGIVEDFIAEWGKPVVRQPSEIFLNGEVLIWNGDKVVRKLDK